MSDVDSITTYARHTTLRSKMETKIVADWTFHVERNKICFELGSILKEAETNISNHFTVWTS